MGNWGDMMNAATHLRTAHRNCIMTCVRKNLKTVKLTLTGARMTPASVKITSTCVRKNGMPNVS